MGIIKLGQDFLCYINYYYRLGLTDLIILNLRHIYILKVPVHTSAKKKNPSIFCIPKFDVYPHKKKN